MKISKLDFRNLRNDAHFQFHTEFKDLVVQHNPLTLKIKPQFDSYLPLYNRVDDALKKIVKSEFTAKIHEADKARDEIYLGMAETVAATLRHFNPNVRQSAERLKILFDTYGNVAGKPLNEETSAIYNILQELKGKYTADAATVGLTEWVAELEARNQTFEGLVKERFDETAHRTDIVLREARGKLDEAYRVIAERINALAVVEGVATYEAFIRTLNAVIAKYAVKHHHHHNHKAPAENSPLTSNIGDKI
jgi:DNA-binding Lrp family transcriptional regulator